MPVLTKINSNVIADDAITGDKVAGNTYLSNTATQNISGTYSENRLYTSDAYTLSGNATINSNITLSTVKPTTDVVLTADGARTITGTGVLSGGSMFSGEKSDLTGMTGELGSAVTGSPALHLGNTTIPKGRILKVEQFRLSVSVSQYNSTSFTIFHKFVYSPDGGANNTSKIQCIFNYDIENHTDTTEGRKTMQIDVQGNDIIDFSQVHTEAAGTYNSAHRTYGGYGGQVKPVQLDGTGNADITFYFYYKNQNAGGSVGFTIKGDPNIFRSGATILEYEA